MTQIDELKKWLNELNNHYEAIEDLTGLLPHDRNYWDAYKSVQSKIAEIEETKAKVFSSNAVLSNSVCEMCEGEKDIAQMFCTRCYDIIMRGRKQTV